MKLVITVVAAVVLVGLIVALGQGTSEDDGSTARSTPTAAVTSTGTVRADDAPEALAMLREVAGAYRKAERLTDTMDIVYLTPNGEQTVTYQVAFGSGAAAMQIPKFRMIVRNDTLFVLREGMEHKFLELPLEGDPMSRYGAVSSGRPVPMHFAMLWTDDVAAMLPSLSMGQLTNARLTGVTRDVPNPTAGGTAHQIDIEADNGKGRLLIDADTRLMASAEMDFAGQDGREYGIQIAFAPVVQTTEPELLSFDPAGLYKVTTMAALDQIGVGEPLPDFAVLTADGKVLRRRHIAGSIAVLDFWATWCGPCKRALPLLEEFHQWAEQSGEPIKVYAVDVWEKFPSSTQKMAAANNYWGGQKFTVPLLMDIDDEFIGSLGFTSIPTTIVVGPDGKVAKIHRGYDPNMKQTLQADVQAILAKQGG